MLKVLLLIGFLPFRLAAQDSMKTIILEGKMENINYEVDQVILNYRTKDEFKNDSFQLKDGKFSFSFNFDEPVLCTLYPRYKDKILRIASIEIFAQPGKIEVTSVDSFTNVKVEGSVAHTEYMKIKERLKPYQDKLSPLYEKYAVYYKAKDETNLGLIAEEIEKVEKEKNEKVYGDYLKNNPSSPLAFYVLKKFTGNEIDPDKTEPLFNSMSSEVKEYPSAVEFKTRLELIKRTSIGKIAMDFTQNDTSGNPVSLSSFRGKYVLVDFWASWCKPCRAENPNLVKVFDKFKDKKFDIIGVSLDRTGQKEKWLKAIHDDKLEWTQLSDLNFWNNEVAKQYGVESIPQNLLIDPKGKIIAKNLDGDELHEILEEMIEGKKIKKR